MSTWRAAHQDLHMYRCVCFIVLHIGGLLYKYRKIVLSLAETAANALEVEKNIKIVCSTL